MKNANDNSIDQKIELKFKPFLMPQLDSLDPVDRMDVGFLRQQLSENESTVSETWSSDGQLINEEEDNANESESANS